MKPSGLVTVAQLADYQEIIDVRTDDDADHLLRAVGRRRRHGADDVRVYLATVYDALTWLQESLVQAMLARGDLGRPGRVGPSGQGG